MARTDFDAQQIAYLQEHWNKTKTAAELAAEMGVASGKCLEYRVNSLRKMGYHFASVATPIGRLYQRKLSNKSTETFIRLKNGEEIRLIELLAQIGMGSEN